MGLVANLFAAGVPATWMDDVDDLKHQVTDSPDATRPDIWQYEDLQYEASGVGPAGEAGINLLTAAADWVTSGVVFNDLGTVASGGSFYPGDGWNMSTGRCVVRYYIDAAVKASAFYLPVLTVYTNIEREGLGAGERGVLVGFYDDTGTNYKIDTFCGVRAGSDYDTSAGFPWADILDKWVEFDVRWRCDTGSFGAYNVNGYVSIRMRTSTDGVTWTDLPGTTDAVILETGQTERIAAPANAWKSGAITYGMSVALGFDGMPGKSYYGMLYDSDEVYTPPAYTPVLDVSDPCCGSGTGTGGGTHGGGHGVTGDIPVVNPNAPYNPGGTPTECVTTFTGETAADLTDVENWRTLAGPTPNMICELHAVKHPDTLGSTTYRWADQGLDLPASSAFVEGRVRRGGWSEIRRAMALPDQYPEVSRAGVTIDEQDALLRTLLDTESTAYLVAREWVSWLISEVGRKASTAMRTAFRGVVSSLNPGPGRTYTIEVEDQITSPFGIFNPDKLVPQIVMTQAFFPPGTGVPGFGVDDGGLPTAGLHKDLEGKPFPILAGTQSDAGALSADGQSAAKGAVPLIWVRDVNLPESPTQVWGEFLICLGETDSIPDIYASDCGYELNGSIATPPRAPRRMLLEYFYGTDVLSPDDMDSWTYFTGLSTRYIERTEGGQTIRYSAIYMRGPRAEHHRLGLVTIAANVCPKAPQTVGPFLQWFYNEHVAKNAGRGYSSGSYGPLETYASDATVPYLQTSTFTAFQDYTKDRLGDAVGYVVRGFQLREQLPLRELEKRFMQDYEVSLPFNHHGQKMLRWIDDLADPTVGTPYRERIEIDEPLPPYRDAHDEIENLVSFQFDYDHDLQVWRREPEELRDDNSIAAHYGVFAGGRRLADGQTPSPFEVYSTSDAATVRDSFQRRQLRKRKAPRYQDIPSDLAALHDEIGDQILLTHSRGVGASGYVARPFYVLEQRHNPNRHQATLGTMDLKTITEGVGVWAGESVPDWDSASDAERSLYLFWAAEDGTVPSGNLPGKEWR